MKLRSVQHPAGIVPPAHIVATAKAAVELKLEG
jgi:hypothetical protein